MTIPVWRTEQRHGDLIDCRIRHLSDRSVNTVDILSAVDEVDSNLLIGETGTGAGKGRHPEIQTGGVRTPVKNARVICGCRLLRSRLWARQKVECNLGTTDTRSKSIEPKRITTGIGGASEDIPIEGTNEALVRTAVVREILHRAEDTGRNLVGRTAALELAKPIGKATRLGTRD